MLKEQRNFLLGKLGLSVFIQFILKEVQCLTLEVNNTFVPQVVHRF